MNKLVYMIFLGFFLLSEAKEPTLGILKKVNSNTKQLFTISNSTFVCESYAVIGIEKLANSKNLETPCRDNINKFYKKNPTAKYYSQSLLYVMQRYHIEFKRDECLLFASGEIVLSEILLREGLAVLKPGFKDEEYKGVFKIAQKNAKIEEKGVWKDSIVRDCIAEIYKE